MSPELTEDTQSSTDQNEVFSSNVKSKLKKDWSSVCDVREGTPVFGTRILSDKDNVWNHNAWYVNHVNDLFTSFKAERPALFIIKNNRDNVQWDEEQEKAALERAGSKKIFEIGCGAGNTMFPLLAENKNPELFVYACDFASNAVDVVLNNQDYDPKKCKAFVWDLTSDEIPECIEQGSLDIVVLIFVMSAIRPQDWKQVVENVYKEIESLWDAKFTIEQNAIDRRLIVNRHRRLQMYRIWLQGKFRKHEN
ncbi:14346_t:CDS:2 [Acaulospora colombiana]|uniref:14346_t:CDS:1 n=1 Tax=Acaulospora colombiana TaxID=27376 RepID=A0ACA9KP33_9GLOM|nr:14346_t:CDS:2 [Acaulospora colombiana]